MALAEKVVRRNYVRLFSLGSVLFCRQDIYKSEVPVDVTNEHGGVEVQLQALCSFLANKFHISEACTVFLEHVSCEVCGYHRCVVF
jgi:hypothetical protein